MKPPSGSVLLDEHTFNDDLLANPGDYEHARRRFGSIIHVLHHPELGSLFQQYDKLANKARARARWLGSVAVVAATGALLGSITEGLWEQTGSAMIISIVLETTAILAALVAAGVLWRGTAKKDWLEARLMTERLRQWHFQLLTCRMQDIAASCDKTNPQAVQEFEAKRAEWFANFCQEYSPGQLGVLFVEFGEEDEEDKNWLHPEEAASLPAGDPVQDLIHDAYGRLRFDHQHRYANHVLRNSTDQGLHRFLRWPPLRQEVLLNTLVTGCMVLAFLSSAAIIGWRIYSPTGAGLHAGVEPAHPVLWLTMLILVCTVLGVAARTVEEGLGISKDVERYEVYRKKLARLKAGFEATPNPRDRLKLMQKLEAAVVEEMKEFLRTHNRAKFLF